MAGEVIVAWENLEKFREEIRRRAETSIRVANKDPKQLERVIHDLAREAASWAHAADRAEAQLAEVEARTPEARLDLLIKMLYVSGTFWEQLEIGDAKIERGRLAKAPSVPSDFKRACTSCYKAECAPDSNLCERCAVPPPERLVLNWVRMTFRDGRTTHVQITPGMHDLEIPPDVVSIRTIAEAKVDLPYAYVVPAAPSTAVLNTTHGPLHGVKERILITREMLELWIAFLDKDFPSVERVVEYIHEVLDGACPGRREARTSKAEPSPHKHRLVGVAPDTSGTCYDCGIPVALAMDGTLRSVLPCGCALGKHPNDRNYASGAAERDGRTCKLGWPK